MITDKQFAAEWAWLREAALHDCYGAESTLLVIEQYLKEHGIDAMQPPAQGHAESRALGSAQTKDDGEVLS